MSLMGWEGGKQRYRELKGDRTARIYVALGAQSDPRLSSAPPSQLLRKGLRTRVSRARPYTAKEPIRVGLSRVADLA